jgi:hypothetical protein
MFEPFVIEIWGKPAGIVLREGNAFRFHAVDAPFFELDGVQFTTLGHARLAAARVESDRRHDLDQAQSLATGLSLGKASHWANNCPL